MRSDQQHKYIVPIDDMAQLSLRMAAASQTEVRTTVNKIPKRIMLLFGIPFQAKSCVTPAQHFCVHFTPTPSSVYSFSQTIAVFRFR